MGSSPRVRGKRRVLDARAVPTGLIPARAGKTASGAPRTFPRRAHPRACGENFGGAPAGPGPRGSSPRVRGKPTGAPGRPASCRLIPARAGKTWRPARPSSTSAAHPRACGENVLGGWPVFHDPGSSPRVRGKHGGSGHGSGPARLIPARAGKTSSASPRPGARAAHPRACGENERSPGDLVQFDGSSPRVRGKPGREHREPLQGRLIPARAGKTRPRPATRTW